MGGKHAQDQSPQSSRPVPLRSPCWLLRPQCGQSKKSCSFVQNGNLTILDPIWTTAYVTRDHGYMIYDTLFSTDEKNAVKPQMVDKYEVSADKTLWTFTLRDGLEWHDGQPVTAEDCVVSLKRWAARDSMGQKLMEFVAELKPVDAKTFTLKLKEPYGLVLDSLGKPSSNVPFMMPKRDRRHRSVQADRQPDRLRPVHLRRTPSPSPARSTSTSRTPSTSRGRSPPRAWPAARSPRSTASSSSTCPTRRSR